MNAQAELALEHPDALPPTAAAAQARIAAVRPAAYARTRNALDGAVSGLSPYITHGFVTLPEVLAGVAARHRIGLQHKFVFELGWREYFRHAWAVHGDAILQSLRTGPRPDGDGAPELPADLRQARTGVPAIDLAVRTLYATGTLHNHARMWLASYTVHLRGVHWRAGADWMIGHLLDGDLASNHLSWQWVAGTASHKPYLFNAENVARHAPPPWHSPGSVIDAPYAELEAIACGARPRPAARPAGQGVPVPPLHAVPPAAAWAVAPDAAAAAGRDVWLVHPWALREPPPDLVPGTLRVGLLLADVHRLWPWSARRWSFVGTRLAELAPQCWHGDFGAWSQALRGARSVQAWDEPHISAYLRPLARCRPVQALFPPVDRPCASFSQWWSRSLRGVQGLDDLPGLRQGGVRA